MNVSHCDIGNHDVAPGVEVSVCAVCDRGVCFEHRGNPDELPGDLVACPLHAELVAEMNRVWWEEYKRQRWSWPRFPGCCFM